MSTAILLASYHHGNTKKLVDAIASKNEVTVIDVLQTKNFDLNQFDKIGVASGVYAFNIHEEMINFIKQNLPENKRVFIMTTSAMDKDFTSLLKTLLKDKKSEILGEFKCGGFCDIKLFKILCGGVQKGRPNDMDIAGAINFYERIKNM